MKITFSVPFDRDLTEEEMAYIANRVHARIIAYMTGGFWPLVLVALVDAASGCVSAGRFKCDGVAITAPIIPVGIHAGYCRDGAAP